MRVYIGMAWQNPSLAVSNHAVVARASASRPLTKHDMVAATGCGCFSYKLSRGKTLEPEDTFISLSATYVAQDLPQLLLYVLVSEKK